MKLIRAALLLPLLILVFAPVLAEDSFATGLVLSPSKAAYNAGEQVRIIGVVDIPENTTNTFIDLYLSGPDNRVLAQLRSTHSGRQSIIDLNGGRPIYVDIASAKSGDYHVTANVKDASGNVLKTIVTDNFQITHDLKIDWTFDKQKAMVGETVLISGSVLYQDNSLAAQGDVTIGNSTYQFSDGIFRIELVVRSANSTTLTAEAKDSFGNSGKSTKQMEVSDKPVISLDVSKRAASPGEEISVMLSVENIRKESVPFDAEISLGGATNSVDSQGATRSVLRVPDSIPPGEQDLHVRAWDKFGNFAETRFRISISEHISSLELAIDKEKYTTNSSLIYNVTALNQAGLGFSGGGVLKIVAESGDTWRTMQLDFDSSGKASGNASVPPSPGNWKLSAEVANSTKTVDFVVKEPSLLSGLATKENRSSVLAATFVSICVAAVIAFFILKRIGVLDKLLKRHVSSQGVNSGSVWFKIKSTTKKIFRRKKSYGAERRGRFAFLKGFFGRFKRK